MSFTSETKGELLHLTSNHCDLIAELSALFAVNGHLAISSEGVGLSFQTTSLPLVRHMVKTVKSLYGVQVDVVSKKQVRLKKKNQYALTVKDKVHTVINELALMDETRGFARTIDEMLTIRPCCRRAYVRGAFLASGSINHPGSSSYHAEFTVPSESLAEALKDLLNTFDLNARHLEKKRHHIVYLKESEKIADLLRIMDASQALLKFENERIQRDFVNSITRVMNMEIANQNKTLQAANHQLKQIAVLENLVEPDTLPETVRQAIFLRKTYPEASLLELSELSGQHYNRTISKSGLNHRFRNIDAMAKEALDAFDPTSNHRD
ncbi:MAG: DNA-binding protein WhiA [Acholeplasmatales bacterium]|nr:MAG: DNA-binding protein WhiA [Acholeplasmatales bacterium]